MSDLAARIQPTNKVSAGLLTAYLSQLTLAWAGSQGIDLAPETAVSIVGVIQFAVMWLTPDAHR